MKIYLNTNKKFKDRQELLKWGFKDGSFAITYYDPECRNEQCHSAWRSFGDLLLICRTYFPRTTEKGLAKTIFKLYDAIGLSPSFCYGIKKVVFSANLDYKDDPIDEAMEGVKDKKGEGTHSWNDIVKLSKS